MKHDITNAVEQLSALEANAQVRLEALFAETEDRDGEHDVYVRGEIHSISGAEIPKSIDLTLSVYDGQGRVVATTNTYLDNESFFAFETFELTCYEVSVKPALLRLYPKIS